jgi:KaiC/GvpD/RAD55 family RecA-like ATPase
MTDTFDPLAAWDALDQGATVEEAAGSLAVEGFIPADRPIIYRHYKPFVEAANSFVWEAQQTKRVYTGIPDFDAEMRGIGPGHLGVIIGYSHSGKTLLMHHILRSNRDKRVAWFSPDEPATLLLTKLTSLTTGVPAKELEARVAMDDKEAIGLLRATALDEFPNLVVYDKQLTASVLHDGYREACDVWGDAADLVVIDYVDLVQVGEQAPAKFDFLKGFVSDEKVPMWAIHQTSRSAGGEGRAMTISSGNYGGEQHATFMIGVRRKKSALMAELAELRVKQLRGSDVSERIDEIEHDLAIHNYTLTANVVKNKRPGGQLVDEIDFEMGLSTGRLFQLQPGDLPQQYLKQLKRMPQPIAPAVRTTTPHWTEESMFDD